jgi:acetyl/propionyl-CoA carboxylase alpha subunit
MIFGDGAAYPLMVKASAGGGGRGIRQVIVPASGLRPYLADAVQRGIAHTLNHEDGTTG